MGSAATQAAALEAVRNLQGKLKKIFAQAMPAKQNWTSAIFCQKFVSGHQQRYVVSDLRMDRRSDYSKGSIVMLVWFLPLECASFTCSSKALLKIL